MLYLSDVVSFEFAILNLNLIYFSITEIFNHSVLYLFLTTNQHYKLVAVCFKFTKVIRSKKWC